MPKGTKSARLPELMGERGSAWHTAAACPMAHRVGGQGVCAQLVTGLSAQTAPGLGFYAPRPMPPSGPSL